MTRSSPVSRAASPCHAAGKITPTPWLAAVAGRRNSRHWNLPGIHAKLRWSPDGQSAAYASYASAPALNRWLLDFATGEPERIEAGQWTALAFAWSPDGRRFAQFSSDHDTLLVTSREGATWRTRSFAIGASDETGQLHWTPDSRRVVYGRSGAQEGVYAVDVAATAPAAVKLTPPGAIVDHGFSEAPLSPDGSRLFVRVMPEALVMDLSTDASATTAIAGPVPSRIWSGWSPDSRHRFLREFRGNAGPENEDVYHLVHLENDFAQTRIEAADLGATYRMYWTPRSHRRLVDTYDQGVHVAQVDPPATLEPLDVPHVTGGSGHFAIAPIAERGAARWLHGAALWLHGVPDARVH